MDRILRAEMMFLSILRWGALGLVALACNNQGSSELSGVSQQTGRITFATDSCIKFSETVPSIEQTCGDLSSVDQCQVKAGDSFEVLGLFRYSEDSEYWLFAQVTQYFPAQSEESQEGELLTIGEEEASENEITTPVDSRVRCSAQLMNESLRTPKRLAWPWSGHLDRELSATPQVQQSKKKELIVHGDVARGVLTSGYGWRWGRMHRGIDIAAPIGTPIRAACAGRVVYSAWHSGGFGNLVDIEHAAGTCGNGVTKTRYAHNSRNLVKLNQWVEAKQEIAKMGSTGRSTGPHLHFEAHAGGSAMNPSEVIFQKYRTAPGGNVLNWLWNLLKLSELKETDFFFAVTDPRETGESLSALLRNVVETGETQIVLHRESAGQMALTSSQMGVQASESEVRFGFFEDEDKDKGRLIFGIDMHGQALPED